MIMPSSDTSSRVRQRSVKYDFLKNKIPSLVVEETDDGPVTTQLYSGPTSQAKLVFPVGDFRLFAEIHEEAEAFAVHDIETNFQIYLPTQEEYEAINVQALVNSSAQNGDQSRVSQLLLADVRKSCSFFLNEFYNHFLSSSPPSKQKHVGSISNVFGSRRTLVT